MADMVGMPHDGRLDRMVGSCRGNAGGHVTRICTLNKLECRECSMRSFRCDEVQVSSQLVELLHCTVRSLLAFSLGDLSLVPAVSWLAQAPLFLFKAGRGWVEREWVAESGCHGGEWNQNGVKKEWSGVKWSWK
eukprot:1158048-Pelagomonas_calceolata.AAC.13